MPRIPNLPEADATDKVAQTYGRIKEMFGSDAVPHVFLAYGQVPSFLQDFYMNFKKFVYSDGKLDAKTKAVLALAVSTNADSDPWSEFLIERCRTLGISQQQIAEVVALSATNAMYNTFFKFRDISGSDVFSGMSVGLRAHTFNSTSFDESTVELINIVISVGNVCKPCTSGHVAQARKLGVSDEAILEAVQCAATMAAGVHYLRAAGH